MKIGADRWKVYRTKYLVRATQLSEKCNIVDGSGTISVGECGDYLVQSSDGTLRLARRDVFEDVYVELEAGAAGVRGRELKEKLPSPGSLPCVTCVSYGGLRRAGMDYPATGVIIHRYGMHRSGRAAGAGDPLL